MNNGATITNCCATEGGGVCIGQYANFYMTGGIITGNSATAEGGGVYNKGYFKMTGGKITKNFAVDGRGGGVKNTIPGKFYMVGNAEISWNGKDEKGDIVTKYGGGVYNANLIWIESYHGKQPLIKGNSSYYKGGGIYSNDYDSVFEAMNGGIISYNESEYGGGMYISSPTDYYGGIKSVIVHNTAFKSGGGICITNDAGDVSDKEPTSRINIIGGKISNNTAGENGGGIYVFKAGYQNPTDTQLQDLFVNITGGEISGNKAMGDGGGIYVGKEGSDTSSGYKSLYPINLFFDITGGKISGNTAAGNGGGIYINKIDDVIEDRLVYSYIKMHGDYGDCCEIIGNEALNNGGGIYNAADLEINYGSIAENTANQDGGGIYNTGTVTFRIGFPEVRGNGAPNGNGGGVYTTDFYNLIVDKGTSFYDNIASASCERDPANDLVYESHINNGITWTSPFIQGYNNYDINQNYIAPIVEHIHIWGEWDITPATCTAAGEKTRVCTLDSTHIETIIIPATGHAWGAWFTSTPATCTSAGYEKRVCANDPAHTETRPIGATGHAWGAWTAVTAATCDTAGTTRRVCGNDSSHVQNGTIPALGHLWGAWTVTTPATCTAAGMETRTCSRNTSHTETRSIPVIGHDWGPWTVTTPATVDHEGEETRTCRNDASHTETRSIAKLLPGGGEPGGDPPIPGRETGFVQNTVPSTQEVLEQIMNEGVPTMSVGNLNIPLSAGEGLDQYVWAFANFVMAIAGIILAAVTIVRMARQKRRERIYAENNAYTVSEEEIQARGRFGWVVMAVVMGILGIVLFFLTENIRNLMVVVDDWTILSAVIFALALAGFRFAFRNSKYDDDLEEEHRIFNMGTETI